MESAFPSEQLIDTVSAYLGAIDDLFMQHTNAEITGDTFVNQAAAIVGDFETNETQQEQFQIFSQQLRNAVAVMSCCSSEAESAFRNHGFFNPVDQGHQFCEDEHGERHNHDKKKKKAATTSAFLLKQIIAPPSKKRFLVTSSK